jgi:hypothetical protein
VGDEVASLVLVEASEDALPDVGGQRPGEARPPHRALVADALRTFGLAPGGLPVTDGEEVVRRLPGAA